MTAGLTPNEALDSLCAELAELQVENARLNLVNLGLAAMNRHLHAAATADAAYIDNLLDVVCTLRSELIAARTQARVAAPPSYHPGFSFEPGTFQDRVSPDRWVTS